MPWKRAPRHGGELRSPPWRHVARRPAAAAPAITPLSQRSPPLLPRLDPFGPRLLFQRRRFHLAAPCQRRQRLARWWHLRRAAPRGPLRRPRRRPRRRRPWCRYWRWLEGHVGIIEKLPHDSASRRGRRRHRHSGRLRRAIEVRSKSLTARHHRPARHRHGLGDRGCRHRPRGRLGTPRSRCRRRRITLARRGCSHRCGCRRLAALRHVRCARPRQGL